MQQKGLYAQAFPPSVVLVKTSESERVKEDEGEVDN